MLGPPDVSVSGCGNCLILKVRVPPTRGLQLHEELVFHVQRTRDGAQVRARLNAALNNVFIFEMDLKLCVMSERDFSIFQPGSHFSMSSHVESYQP